MIEPIPSAEMQVREGLATVIEPVQGRIARSPNGWTSSKP